MTKLLCAVSLLMSASALRADVFQFSYTGVTGTLTATATVAGVYTVTDIYGTRNNVGFDYSPVGMGTFTLNGSTAAGTIKYSLGPSNLPDSVTFAGSVYTETVQGSTPVTGNNFSISKVSVSESAGILLFPTMGLGVWILVRKMKIQPRSAPQG